MTALNHLISIGVFGSSLPPEGSEAYEEARAVGREIARRGGGSSAAEDAE